MAPTSALSPRRADGFTLVELLVAAGIVVILAAIGIPATGAAIERAREARCAAILRSLGKGVLAYAGEHGGHLPRSNHSAGTTSERGWMREILPYLGEDRDAPRARYHELLARLFRCPCDTARVSGTSYGLNVYFELRPDYDEYEGAPQTWRTLASIPRPGRTILLAEVPASADHVMAHFWGPGGYGGDVAATRHRGRSHYAFADGRVERLSLEETFGNARDLWNPGLAR